MQREKKNREGEKIKKNNPVLDPRAWVNIKQSKIHRMESQKEKRGRKQGRRNIKNNNNNNNGLGFSKF